jgi:hypothetical protein
LLFVTERAVDIRISVRAHCSGTTYGQTGKRIPDHKSCRSTW